MALITVTTSRPAEWVPLRGLGPLTFLSGDVATAVYAVAGDEPRLLRVTGTGMAYDSGGFPTSGTVTALQLLAGTVLPGAVLHSITGISFAAEVLVQAVRGPDLFIYANDTVIGAAGADRLAGDDFNDSLDGRGGDDRLDGGDWNDTLLGNAGNDVLTGGDGNDLLLPGTGRDIVRAGSGNDTIRLTEPEALNGRAEVFDGGVGEDLLALALPHGALLDLSRAELLGIEALRFETATRLAISAEALLDLLLVDLAYDPAAAGGLAPGFVLGGVGDFILGAMDIRSSQGGQRLVMQVADGHGAVVFGRGAAQDFGGDVILGGNGASTIFGEGGADSLFAGGGTDLLDGGTGADTLRAGSGGATLYGKEDGDLLLGGAGFYTQLGQGGADTLLGGEGRGHLSGGTADDLLDGGNSAATLDGGLGADTIRGGVGNDTYLIRTDDTGADVILDAGGLDTALVLGGSYTLTGLFEIERLSRAGTLVGTGAAESVIGSNFDDSLAGAAGNDTLLGHAGADTLSGGAGSDVYWIGGRSGSDRITEFDRVAGDRDLIDVSSLTTPDFRVVPVGSPASGKTITFETVGGTHSILRGYLYSPSNLVFEVRVDITGPWSAADFIL